MKAKIHYHDIGDYLSREEKLKIISDFKSFANMPLVQLQPNEHGDWISVRNDVFSTFIPIEPEKKFDLVSKTFFNTFSLGLCTNRDAWCYNSSLYSLEKNLKFSLQFYNKQRLDFIKEKMTNPKLKFDEFVTFDSSKLNWTDTVKKDAEKGIEYGYDNEANSNGLYRPFFKQNVYFSNKINHRVYQMPKLFPKNGFENLVICVTGAAATKPFSILITNIIPNLDTLEKAQCFPLYYYEENTSKQKELFDKDAASADSTSSLSSEPKYIRRDAISDFILERAKQQYNIPLAPFKGGLAKEDIFYYVYGFLHSKEYRETFANDLKKMLPRLPLVEDVKDFWAFSKAGRQLAELHLNYETVPPHPAVITLYSPLSIGGALQQARKEAELEYLNYRVQKMRFPKKDQKDSIIYNSQISLENIPAKAYEYVVNGKSAIEWVMERYQITTHKESGITNDPNDWAKEVGNPRYILDLLLSIINVSVQTVDIVDNLPKVDFT